MFSLRFVVLFVHIVAVIVALGGSLFSTFALAPVLAASLHITAWNDADRLGHRFDVDTRDLG